MPEQPALFSLSGLFKITRVWNLVIIVLTQMFTAVFLLDKEWENIRGDYYFFLLMASTVIIAAAGYIINDYYDVKIDYINRPDRVVVGRKLKRRVVMVVHLVLNFLGTVAGLLISWPVLIINMFSIGLLWLYSNQLKRMPFIGNFSISLLTALAVIVVAVFYWEFNSALWLYAGFAFFFTLLREIIKDIQDLKGDAAFGCRTLPIVWGIRKTKRFIYLLILIFSTVLLIILDFFPGPFWNFFFIGLVFAQILLGLLLYRADTVRHFGMLSQLCKLIMIGGVVTMIIG